MVPNSDLGFFWRNYCMDGDRMLQKWPYLQIWFKLIHSPFCIYWVMKNEFLKGAQKVTLGSPFFWAPIYMAPKGSPGTCDLIWSKPSVQGVVKNWSKNGYFLVNGYLPFFNCFLTLYYNGFFNVFLFGYISVIFQSFFLLNITNCSMKVNFW